MIVCALSLACREPPRAAPASGAIESTAPRAEPAAAPGMTAGGREERKLAREPLADLSPPDTPSQRLAFSRGRLAWLQRDEVRVFALEDFALIAHFRAPDARNVVALTGGGFLIADRDHVWRLSGAERRPERFPRAPRIGPTTIFPSRIESEQFWLYYAGISRLPRFDLGASPRVASLPMLDWTELIEFDRGALLGLGDGSFVYTTAQGLRRIDVEGRPEALPQPELAGRVWALGRDRRLDRVWAATEQHLYLLHARDGARVVRRFELGPHPVALAAEAGTVALLAIEAMAPGIIRCRVDVYVDGLGPPRVLRFDSTRGDAADAGAPRFAPPTFVAEIALSEADGLVAVLAGGLQVHDYRRGVRKDSLEGAAQKLAPTAP